MRSLQALARPGFTVGVCVTGAPRGIDQLIKRVLSEADSARLKLNRLVVIASGCPEAVVSNLRAVEEADRRVQVVAETSRHGKADAINKIQARAQGDCLVFLNSDAHPEPGAIARLVSEASSDSTIGALSATPTVASRRGLTALLLEVMWTAHNECSLRLNHMGLSNHSCDELVVFRSSALSFLPTGTVNDGAYLAAIVRRGGLSVKVSPSVRVRIETPTRISDVIAQRRRILFGHAQVWRRLGSPPKTLESMLFLSPLLGLRLVSGILAKHPKFIPVLPLAILCELGAFLLSLVDNLISTKMHTVWRRFN